MKLLRWMSAIGGAGALAVVTPATAKAQDCSGNRFATCATVAIAPVAMGALLLGTQVHGPKGPLDLVYFATTQKKVATVSAGCPSPNGEHGAESVAEHNPHCNGTAGPENGGPVVASGPDHGSAPEVTASLNPEPATIVLLGTALLTLGAGAFSRRKKSA